MRAAVAARLGALSAEQLRAASGVVCDRLNALPEWRTALTYAGKARGGGGQRGAGSGIMLYVAGADEPDVTVLAEEVLRTSRVALPRVTDWGGRAMDAAWVGNLGLAPAGDLEVTRHGVRQPGAACPAAEVAQIDLCVVPGRAFDKLCNRLGRGGGFYDVFLERAVFAGPQGRVRDRRPVLVGVCFDEQLVERVPVGALDVGLDIVVTPSGTYRRQ